MSKIDPLESLYSTWGTRPLDYLFQCETEQFNVDLLFANVTEHEYLEYARKHR